MLTRKELLQRGAVAGAGLMLPGAWAPAAFGVPTLKSYQANLLNYIPPIEPVANGGTVNLAIREVLRKVHPAAPATRVWSYELANGDPRISGNVGTWIGPILALDAGSSITVNYHYGSFERHLLEASIDRTMLDPYVLDPANGPETDDLRFMTHLHGAFVDGPNDGNPFARHHRHEFKPGATETIHYPAQDRAALIWYHQHAHGITHLNVYAGLAGGYLLRDAIDTGRLDNELGLPANVGSDLYEIPLVIQDRMFKTNKKQGTLELFYPAAPWIPEFFGTTMCVNGAYEPFLEVEPRPYRFRIINGCNARFINLEWKGGNLTGLRPDVYVVGSDGGFIPAPFLTQSIVIAPGERLDVVVDFTRVAGELVKLDNKPLKAPVVNPAGTLARIMQFNVTKTLKPTNLPINPFDPAAALTTDTPAASLTAPGASKTRYHSFEEVMGMAGPLGAVINGMSFEGRKIIPGVMTGYPYEKMNVPEYGVTEKPKAGDTEDWVFANATADTHPLHMHLVQFGVIERRPFNVAGYLAALAAARAPDGSGLLPNNTIDPTPYILPGAATPVSPAEMGWKDTVQMHPGEVTRIRAKFDLKDEYDAPQDYVFHCHILEHESNSMMRPFRVEP